MQDKCSQISKSEFMIYLEDIARTIKGSLSKLPKKRNSPESMNIYMSCLLTFMDLITPSIEDKEKLDAITRSEVVRSNLF